MYSFQDNEFDKLANPVSCMLHESPLPFSHILIYINMWQSQIESYFERITEFDTL